MRIALDEVVHFDVVTHNPATGAVSDADSTPSFEVFEESTDTDIGVGANFTKRTSKTGNYRGSFTASAANGFEVGKWYAVIASATVNSIAGKSVAMHFTIVPAESSAGVAKTDTTHFGGSAGTFASGIPEVKVASIANNAITENAINNNAITDAKVASDVTIASVTGAVGSVTGNVGGNVAGSVGSVSGNVGGNVAGSVGSVTGNVGGNVVGTVASVVGNVGGNVTGSVGSLATQAKADVNAEVLDVLNVDTYAEIGQGNPPATSTLIGMWRYLYKLFRNEKIQDENQFSLMNDAGTVVDQKSTISQGGGVLTRGKMVSGP